MYVSHVLKVCLETLSSLNKEAIAFITEVYKSMSVILLSAINDVAF